jgi:hypothetical protein
VFSQQRSSSIHSDNPYFISERVSPKMKFNIQNSHLELELADAFLRLKQIQNKIKK